MTHTTTATTKCSRCAGSGKLPEYAHVAEGVCFSCKGLGTLPMATVERRQRDRARREAKRMAAAEARMLARMAAAHADGMTVADWAAEVTVDGQVSDNMRAAWQLATEGVAA